MLLSPRSPIPGSAKGSTEQAEATTAMVESTANQRFTR